jgi:hypothetical protein
MVFILVVKSAERGVAISGERVDFATMVAVIGLEEWASHLNILTLAVPNLKR